MTEIDDPNETVCANCRFFEPIEHMRDEGGSAPGYCHRYPPVYLGPLDPDDEDSEPWFYSAKVVDFDWCGEFQAKQK